MAIIFKNHTVRFTGKDYRLLQQIVRKSRLTSTQVLEESMRTLARQIGLKVPAKGKPWFHQINPRTSTAGLNEEAIK